MRRLAGKRDQRVTIQAPSYAASTQSGQGVASFSTLRSVWASVRALSGDERLAAGSIASEVTYEIETDYWPDVTPANRVTWTPFRGTSAKTFQVHAVKPGMRHGGDMILECGVVE